MLRPEYRDGWQQLLSVSTPALRNDSKGFRDITRMARNLAQSKRRVFSSPLAWALTLPDRRRWNWYVYLIAAVMAGAHETSREQILLIEASADALDKEDGRQFRSLLLLTVFPELAGPPPVLELNSVAVATVSDPRNAVAVAACCWRYWTDGGSPENVAQMNQIAWELAGDTLREHWLESMNLASVQCALIKSGAIRLEENPEQERQGRRYLESRGWVHTTG